MNVPLVIICLMILGQGKIIAEKITSMNKIYSESKNLTEFVNFDLVLLTKNEFV